MNRDEPSTGPSTLQEPRQSINAPVEGWRGRITASLIGGTLLSFAVALAITIYVPGSDGLDEAFMGGLVLMLIWPLAMIWVLFARSGRAAWRRVLLPLLTLVAVNLAGLLR